MPSLERNSKVGPVVKDSAKTLLDFQIQTDKQVTAIRVAVPHNSKISWVSYGGTKLEGGTKPPGKKDFLFSTVSDNFVNVKLYSICTKAFGNI